MDLTLQQQLEKMRQDWDARARENARHFVATARNDWTDEEFFRSGEKAVSEDILTDMTNICQGKDPKAMRVLEIGCGAGRLTRALSNLFGEVHAVPFTTEFPSSSMKLFGISCAITKIAPPRRAPANATNRVFREIILSS